MTIESILVSDSSEDDTLVAVAEESSRDDAKDEHGNGFARTAFPLVENDAPYIGKHHVECHQDTE